MRRTCLLVLCVLGLALAGCLDGPADHARIFNDGTFQEEVYVVFSSADGLVRQGNRSLAPGEHYDFPLDHPRDGTYHLVVEAEGGRSAAVDLTWQGSTGPARVRFFVHDESIDSEVVVY